MTVYSDNILDHFQFPRNKKKLIKKNVSFSVNNSSCGDSLTFEGHIENNVLTDIGFTGSGCAISMASASIISQKVKGLKIEEILNIKKEDVFLYLGIDLSINRVKCALLAWEGILKLVSEKK